VDIKKMIIPALLLSAVVLAGAVGVKTVSAVQDEGTYPAIIQKLAERFNLNTDEVKQVFDEERQQQQQRMRASFEERVDQAVVEGTITEEQKEAILQKQAELQNQHEALMDFAPEERRAVMQKNRQELESWAQENGIDLSLFLGNGPRGIKGFGKMGGEHSD